VGTKYSQGVSFSGRPGEANRGRTQGKNIEILKVDVTDQASVDTAIVQLLEKSGNKLDVVVNNAAWRRQVLSEAFHRGAGSRFVSRVNCFLAFQRVLRATLPVPVLRAKRAGLVINVGSILGRVTLPFSSGCMELRSTPSRR